MHAREAGRVQDAHRVLDQRPAPVDEQRLGPATETPAPAGREQQPDDAPGGPRRRIRVGMEVFRTSHGSCIPDGAAGGPSGRVGSGARRAALTRG
ncbi:hypothetical protein GCM10010335_03580 [Streptomyces galbus]|nr:hypothetical protein GCM10010335_03580 [Streptomyces galbus]